jgi:hypothetical protein
VTDQPVVQQLVVQQLVVQHLDIVEFAAACARMRAFSLDQFELVGSWVTTTVDGGLQRLLAQACHQHAWHAELWSDRFPKIPVIDLEQATASYRKSIHQVANSERLAAYRLSLDHVLDELTGLTRRIDQCLDPSTARTIELVKSDLTRIHVALNPYIQG